MPWPQPRAEHLELRHPADPLWNYSAVDNQDLSTLVDYGNKSSPTEGMLLLVNEKLRFNFRLPKKNTAITRLFTAD
jgi:hypothetical protein